MEEEGAGPQFHDTPCQAYRATDVPISYKEGDKAEVGMSYISWGPAVPLPALIIHIAFSFTSGRIGTRSHSSPVPSTYKVASEHCLID